MLLSSIMVSMWVVAMYLNGGYDTYPNPVARWIAIVSPLTVKTFRLRKPKKPPDPGCPVGAYGAWSRWLHHQHVHHYALPPSASLVVDPVLHAPDVPTFFWPGCSPSCTPTSGDDVSDTLSDFTFPSDTGAHDHQPDLLPRDKDLCFDANDLCFDANTLPWQPNSKGAVEINVASTSFLPLNPVTEVNSAQILAQHPKAYLANTSTFELLLDSGASCCVTHLMSDFVTPITLYKDPRVIGGIASGIPIEGVGVVDWTMQTDAGSYRTIRLEACYVPLAGRRLLSPQCADQQRATFPATGLESKVNGDIAKITMRDNGELFSAPLDKRTNLPLFKGYLGVHSALKIREINLCITDENNQNINQAQKELLRWHFRLGHLNWCALQHLLRSGALGKTRLQQSAANCRTHPKCSSCQYGKGKRRPTPSSTSQPVREREGALKKEDLFPGQAISVDHFVCSTTGRLYESRGQSKDNEKYVGGLIFVDHASGFIHIEFVISLNATETIAAKQRFERTMMSQGVTIVSYQADNGTFSAASFVKELSDRYQEIDYSGVGAPHQNGVAERNIGTIMSMARTMMLHAAVRWPDVADSSLWPMAVDYAVYIFNHVPNSISGISPIELSTRTAISSKNYHHLHVWGSPAYVLDPTLQGGKKLPKWKPRSRRAVFVGLSKKHAASIPLVLNLTSLAIFAQFHVIFDDWFTTVASSLEEDEVPEWWDNLFDDSRFQYRFDDNDPVQIDKEWLSEQEKAHLEFEKQRQRVLPPPAVRPEGDYTPRSEGEEDTNPVSSFEKEREPVSPPTMEVANEPPGLHLPPEPAPSLPVEPLSPPPISGHRRYPDRVRKPVDRLSFSAFIETQSAFIAEISNPLAQRAAHQDLLCFDPDTGERDSSNPSLWAYAASKADPDTLRYHEAMSSMDAEGFKEAMAVEIDSLTKLETWSIMKRDNSKNILQGTWAFKRKRFPDGRVRKLKARFCVRGDQQIEGVDFFECYAPVVQWSTVRVVLIFVMMFGLETRQVDYNNAFAQAECKEEVYVELPRGYGSDKGKDSMLKLNKSLYGLRQASKTFYDHMVTGLIAEGFKVSENDPCLFIHEEMLAISWVDDVIFVARDANKIETTIKNLKAAGYDMESEGEISAFLGIQIDKNDHSFTLTQTGLIEKVIKYTGLENCKPDKTPASTTALGSDVDGELWIDNQEHFEYAVAVGMLMYLSNNTRPDIAFAVHQCARFTHSPRQSHGKAVKRIIRYLQGTKDKGIIFTPTGELVVDCYVDADFAGLWGSEDDQDPISVKSRTGYVLELAGCPLSWTSKLQTEIALSTMESEYIALSQSMRELIPVRRLVSEISSCIASDAPTSCRTFSKVFEDNSGALQMAKIPRITLRNRHFSIKYHFYREMVKNGDIQVVKVDSEFNKSDCLTKGLGFEAFPRIRKLIMGW